MADLQKWNVSTKPLVWGFLLSIALTLAAYFLVVKHHLTSWFFVFVIIGLATTQALIQLVAFMHLGIEDKPRWGLMTFLFLALVVFVVIGGSIWIMYNLNYNVMAPNMGQ